MKLAARFEYIQSLRELADMLEANPLLPMPGESTLKIPPARSGSIWDDAENEQLVDELRDGLSWTDIAKAHKRTVGGVRSRAEKMLEAAPDATYKVLRGLLVANREYDWRGHLARNTTRSSALNDSSSPAN